MISKSSVNIMKYLTRSLLVNDRYQKLHNGQVKCHVQLKTVIELLQILICEKKAAQFVEELDHQNIQDWTIEQRSDGEKIIKGGGVSKTTRPEDIMKIINSLFANDYKVLHVIERLSAKANFHL